MHVYELITCGWWANGNAGNLIFIVQLLIICIIKNWTTDIRKNQKLNYRSIQIPAVPNKKCVCNKASLKH